MVNPSTGEVCAKVANASAQDVQKANSTARSVFDSGVWSGLSLDERQKVLGQISKTVKLNAKELAELESLSTGKTSKQATFIDVPTCAETFEYFANLSARELEDRINPVPATVNSITVREPVGVVAQIIPWNYPLIMFAWKVAPALLTGNCVVFKPSPLGCLSILRLAELIAETDLPAGVLNVVATDSNEVSAELVTDPNVDMISFTGGTQTGQTIMKAAADSTKKVSLELGGKSPNLVFADCDQEAALGGTMSAIFMNQGQMCTAGSRLYIEESFYDEFLQKLVAKTKDLKIGPADDYTANFGPVISVEHRDRLLAAIEQAQKDGAKLECGGKIPEAMDSGAYIEPTILSNVSQEMAIVQEELFGPVLAVQKFNSEEEAIALANDSQYGLAACVWIKDLDKARRIANHVQAGTVWVNTYGGFYNEASFGGYKQSGFGRELGVEGLLEYTQSKHICIDKTPGGVPLAASWF